MLNVGLTMAEIGVATTAGTVVATSVDASPLLTALISFGVTVVTVVGSEFVKYLVALLKKKTKELDSDSNKEDKKEDKKDG